MGKTSKRRPGDDQAWKAAPWPPESPTLRKLAERKTETEDKLPEQDCG